jgi:hypothetical protein
MPVEVISAVRSSDLAIPRSISLTRGTVVLVPRQHQVVGGDVPVHDVLAMEVAEREERLVSDLERERDAGRPLLLQEVGEVDTVDVLHDEIGLAFLVQGKVVDRADVGMFEACRGPRLIDEAALHVFVGE